MEDWNRFRFRVWDPLKGCWLHRFKEFGGCSIVGESILFGQWLEGVRLEDHNKLIFEQCTGRTDKGDNLVYEGDIVIPTSTPNGVKPWPYVVRYGDGTWDSGVYEYVGFYCESIEWNDKDGYGHIIYDCEIIGNIHENPELLEAKDEYSK